MKKFIAKEVDIGGVVVGGQQAVRIQSMTNTNTLDTAATVAQVIQLIEAGCAYVRITTPGMKEAENLKKIKKILRDKGFHTPLIADVHFNPKIAEYCATFVEKVRINPGNYVDKKNFKKTTYTDKAYKEELEHIAHRIKPLIDICKKHDTAIRIGTNHGSLSDRIVNRYGDTPLGMVEATMEFLRLFAQQDFHKAVVSLKASNPLVMIEANRLLAKKMTEESLAYPIHLGVTEAGMGEDGRIKSALGIGTLLQEGIGHTIRVSLTENPVKEVPFAKILVESFANISTRKRLIQDVITKTEIPPGNLKESFYPNYPLVVMNFKGKHSEIFSEKNSNCLPDFLCFKNKGEIFKNDTGENLSKIYAAENVKYPFWDVEQFVKQQIKKEQQVFVCCKKKDFFNDVFIEKLKVHKKTCLIPKVKRIDALFKIRLNLLAQGINVPLLYELTYNDRVQDHWLARLTVEAGQALLKNVIDGFFVNVKNEQQAFALNTCFGIFQAIRLRISKTEYISCPTCGRTSFDIEKTLLEIMRATTHLKGLKIGVMGCVVNGPGEMADADYGYVGGRDGKIHLYRGQNAVEKNIPQDKALEKLLALIKKDGKWTSGTNS